ncbi:SRPBCC family protein [Arthrobacter globiformis]|uniref:SRPBCC family protein n=1 Tax=Arthrobacter globiformis TaxID=1665 RepID=UPI0027894FA1|nr:SRPBCC family protein [Arthrobacter globiformis]MDQ0866979.1 ribosome-associated toxin RatA of RatAB toxin-antitoxin module [Arthrobacter globiformis]
MSTRVEKRILVNVPVSTAYNQWTQFEDFPHFMGGVKKVTQLSDDRLEWVAEIAGVKRKWEARILEQKPDQKVAWAATEGATNAGSVEFEDVGGGQTSIKLFIDYEPEGIVEKIGDKLHVVEHQAEADLKRFKAFIEDEGYASGAWRGSVNEGGTVGTPGVEHAAGSLGDSGKAGVSGKMAAAAGVAAAAGAAAAVAAGGKDKDTDAAYVVDETVTLVVPEYTETTVVTDTTDTPGFSGGTAADTVAGGTAAGGTVAGGTAAGAGSALTDETIAHPFDQTNGLIDDEGDSDETAASDTRSAADRAESADRDPGTIPPLGGTSGQH